MSESAVEYQVVCNAEPFRRVFAQLMAAFVLLGWRVTVVLHGRRRVGGASVRTLAARTQYGGRKGRSAFRRLREAGFAVPAALRPKERH